MLSSCSRADEMPMLSSCSRAEGVDCVTHTSPPSGSAHSHTAAASGRGLIGDRCLSRRLPTQHCHQPVPPRAPTTLLPACKKWVSLGCGGGGPGLGGAHRRRSLTQDGIAGAVSSSSVTCQGRANIHAAGHAGSTDQQSSQSRLIRRVSRSTLATRKQPYHAIAQAPYVRGTR